MWNPQHLFIHLQLFFFLITSSIFLVSSSIALFDFSFSSCTFFLCFFVIFHGIILLFLLDRFIFFILTWRICLYYIILSSTYMTLLLEFCFQKRIFLRDGTSFSISLENSITLLPTIRGKGGHMDFILFSRMDPTLFM